MPANGLAAGNNQFVLWGGNVGIGTANPQATLDVAGTVRGTAISGDGANLTGLNASHITAGTIADARLSANVPLLDDTSVGFSGQLTANTLRGGNGSLSVMAVQGTSGSSTGVYGNSSSGTGVRGYSSGGTGVSAQSVNGFGISANSGTSYGIEASGGDVGIHSFNTSGTTRDVYLSTRALAADFYGDLNVRDHTLFLRGGQNHGLGWYGSGKPFAGTTPDGPVLFGWNCGALGTTCFGESITMTWDPWGWGQHSRGAHHGGGRNPWHDDDARAANHRWRRCGRAFPHR